MRFVFGASSLLVLGATTYLIWREPALGLKVLWNAIVPLAPILFLFATNLWVSLCPFAFLQSLPSQFGLGGTKRLSPAAASAFGYGSWLALFLLVPLRHSLFDRSAGWAIAAIVGIALVSVASGFVFQGLAGWCNALCPVRSVESLYGLFSVYSRLPAECSPCSACTTACGRSNKSSWVKDSGPVSFLAYGFPGFVTVFFLSADLADPGAVYLAHAGGALCSGLILGLGRLAFSHATVLRISAAIAIAIYYGFTIPRVMAAWGPTLMDSRL